MDVPRHEALAGLRAMAMVARSDGALSETERALLSSAASALHVDCDERELASPIEPEELLSVISDASRRELVVQAMIMTALMDGNASALEVELIERYASALGVAEPRVKNLRQLHEGRIRTLWLDLARRSFARPIFEETLREKGPLGVWKIVGPMLGLAKDPDLARKYNDLGKLPAGTLGRGYWDFIVQNDLGFPGEGVVGEDGVWHDMTHVLGGYGTEPDGEVSVVSFIAGYRREDPFFWLFTIALQFHLGVRVSPYSPGLRGHFDPAMVLRALERGAAMNTDISTGWDPWPEMARPLDVVRRELGVPG